MSASDIMTEEHRSQLRSNLDTIVNLLRVPDTVTDKLVSEGVLTKEEHEDLTAIQSRNKRARELVMLLTKTSEKGFGVFMEALLDTNQHPLASRICPSFPSLKGLCSDFSQPQQETTAENDKERKFVVPSGTTDAQELKYAFFNIIHRMEDCLESFSEMEKEKLRSETAYFLKLLDQDLETDKEGPRGESSGFLKLSDVAQYHTNTSPCDTHANTSSCDTHANTSPCDTHANTSSCDTLLPKIADSDDVEMDEDFCDSPGEGQMTKLLEQEINPTVLFDIEEPLSDAPSWFADQPSGTECSNVVRCQTQHEHDVHPAHLSQRAQAHQQGFVCQPSGTEFSNTAMFPTQHGQGPSYNPLANFPMEAETRAPNVSLHQQDQQSYRQHCVSQPYDAYQNSMSHSHQPTLPDQQQLCTSQSHDVSLSERPYDNYPGNPTSTMTYTSNHQGPCLHGYSPTN